MNDVTIRPGRRDDLPAILSIYNHYVEHTHISFDTEPHSLADREQWFESISPAGRYRLMAALDDKGLIGYTHSLPFKSRAAYDTSVETTVYLKPGCEGRGIGTRLYASLLDQLPETGLHRAYGAIALPNDASIALHEKLGFRKAAHYSQVGFKFGRFWDVQYFELDLKKHIPRRL